MGRHSLYDGENFSERREKRKFKMKVNAYTPVYNKKDRENLKRSVDKRIKGTHNLKD